MKAVQDIAVDFVGIGMAHDMEEGTLGNLC